MLLVVDRENEGKVGNIFAKWDLSCRRIGTTSSDDKLTVFSHGTMVAEVPAESLVLGGGAPAYARESREPDYIMELREIDIESLRQPDDYNSVLLRLMSSLNICSRR